MQPIIHLLWPRLAYARISLHNMNKLVLQQERATKEQREKEQQEMLILFENNEQALEYMDAWWARHRMIIGQAEMM